MWYKYLAIFFLFFFLAVLQSSFFAPLGFSGVFPNFVFILFFVLVFFTEKKLWLPIFIYALFAGFFLDIFFQDYFGPMIISLIAIGFLAKYIRISLREKREKFPFSYFIPLFLFSFMVFRITFFREGGYLNFNFFLDTACNTVFAAAVFLAFKIFLGKPYDF